MASFNLCTFIGRVGTEPEQRASQEGVQVSRFRLAIDAPSKEKETMWLTVVSFKKLADLVSSYVKKGALVLVSGRLSISIYTDKQNQEKTAVEILANDVVFLTPKPKRHKIRLKKQHKSRTSYLRLASKARSAAVPGGKIRAPANFPCCREPIHKRKVGWKLQEGMPTFLP